MGLRRFRIASIIFVCITLFISISNAQDTYEEKHIEVSLRMIGHQILLGTGDSTSRVLPIVRENDQYRIQFEAEFAFNPDELVNTVNRVMRDTEVARGYFLEVEECETDEVVYSFEMNDLDSMHIIPCKARGVPKSCYSILFTLIEENEALQPAIPNPKKEEQVEESHVPYPLIIALLTLLGALFFFVWRRKKSKVIDPNLIVLGKYQFDQRKAELILEELRIELTGKESDLLLLLYNAANTTVERDVILNKIWGDEGDYVGRTLDVFISKLRKKLEADSSLKIVNIRGVGYKLVMDV
jgi:DNA-binding response OmpR family regulator